MIMMFFGRVNGYNGRLWVLYTAEYRVYLTAGIRGLTEGRHGRLGSLGESLGISDDSEGTAIY